jgi:CubicO group peptidase (beta-lactamase class C family)
MMFLMPTERRSITKKKMEIIPSNPSWKVLGGGLQASAYDLVRWGRRVVNGSILSPESLETMWTVPEPTPCIGDDDNDLSNYALGWYARTEQGTPVVAHGGSWSGYSSYIRMYPEEEIVIVVLSNRRGGGARNGQLGQAIGTLVLTESQTSR